MRSFASMIEFIYNTDYTLRYEKKVLEWLVFLADNEGISIKNLQYNYVSTEEMLRINKKFLDHNFLTDVITFDYSDNGQISGEVFICQDQVETNAREHGETADNETVRVISHAFFHLCGYKDRTPDQKLTMRLKEGEAIAAFHTFLK